MAIFVSAFLRLCRIIIIWWLYSNWCPDIITKPYLLATWFCVICDSWKYVGRVLFLLNIKGKIKTKFKLLLFIFIIFLSFWFCYWNPNSHFCCFHASQYIKYSQNRLTISQDFGNWFNFDCLINCLFFF